ncbi:hypothetical protein [Calothrix sp. PCC 6303]|uniref:hypothetical protein n=1 Tax=Calothrix sp. PCC 6303 TaxID=1170562 RepID=UPI0002A0374D|nr:hypothetical protein [Calothrix sp. PCC 6303]AFY99153.1 hypothetical protein Cal6303_0044 [Calothrix sp. PCC 6303]
MIATKSGKFSKIWFERLIALIATTNLLLVLFDTSYIVWRDFYFKKLPQLTQLYDPIKGIEPHRDVVTYLNTVQQLEEQVAETGLQSSQVATKLEEIRRLSNEMIESNPFAAVGKSGTLEKVKNRIRDRISKSEANSTNKKSAKAAFATFWSQSYLSQRGWNQEINYFNQQIKPAIATTYYRQIGENGEFIDKFWLIDCPFLVIFITEFLGRIYFIKRRNPEYSYLESILWRWYDLFLFIPFMRWLRIIPVLIRLDKAHLINLQPIRKQLHQGIVANFAEEITEIVVIRIINQLQGSIQRGELTRWLMQPETNRPYIDINNVNEVEAITTIFTQAILYQVLPQIQPEITAILRHTIDSALNQTPIYRNLPHLPGLEQIQTQLSEKIATEIANNLYKAIISSVEDPVSGKLSRQLIQRFIDTLGGEIQKKHVVSEVQDLLSDFLEEVKINYVQRLSQEDIEQILEQSRQIRTQTDAKTLTPPKFFGSKN